MIAARSFAVALGLLLPALAQPDQPPAFDAVSVKAVGAAIQYGPGPGMTLGLRFLPTRVTGNSQIFAMIQEAWSLKALQLEVNLGEHHTDVYAIDAVMPEGTSRETANRMMQNMLITRFGLKFHHETKEISVYVLTVGKDSSKLQTVDPEKVKEKVFDTPMGPRKGFQSIAGSGFYLAAHTTMADFAAQMSNSLDRPVIDQTGLTGTYTIDLRWDHADPMELVAAIEHQLGLKLEKRKVPYDIFVVDHVDVVPTPN